MQLTLPRHEIVLLGAGHTNAQRAANVEDEPRSDARVTLVSNFPVASYSGMLPGVLAGQYPPDRMLIDLPRFCAGANVRLILSEVTGVDLENSALQLSDRPDLPFDALSIGIGSVPTTRGVQFDSDAKVLAIKPMQTFLDRLEERLRQLRAARGRLPLRMVIVGGGVGGVEIAFCLPVRLQKLDPGAPFELTLVHAGDQLAPGRSTKNRVDARTATYRAGC